MVKYRDENGNIRKELLSEEAQSCANDFVVLRNNKPDNNPKNSITSAQLRKFYNDFKSLEKKYQAYKRERKKEQAFSPVLPLVKMVKSKVAYASSPGNEKVPRAFADWLSRNVDAINSAEDFEAFLLHFEAVVGFCYGKGLSN